MKLETCPFCKKKPKYCTFTVHQSWDDAGHRNFGFVEIKTKDGIPFEFPVVKDLSAESIECVNLECVVRPKMTRVNTGDAVKLWNTLLSR